MVATTHALEDAIRRTLPPNVFPCTACGVPYRSTGKKVRGVRFRISGCPDCGHIARRTKRAIVDLTRAEAQALAEAPDFPRIRDIVEQSLSKQIG